MLWHICCLSLGNTNTMTKQFSLLFVSLCFAVISFGQQTQDQNLNRNDQNNFRNNRGNQSSATLSFGLEVATPMNQFNSTFDGVPVGIAGQILLREGVLPLEYGVGFSWLSRGTMDSDIDVYQGTDFEGDDIYSNGSLNVNSNIYTGTGIIRLRPFTGRIQPYAEFAAGGRSFSTVSIISVDDTEEAETRDNQHRDFALTYGWGAGMRVKLSEGIAIEGRFTNMSGTGVELVDRESIEVDPEGRIDFERLTTRTDMWSIQLGISIGF